MINFASLAILAVVHQAPTIQSFVQPSLQDITIVARIVKADQNELKKINKDFGTSYRFETTKIFYKEPYKLRAEASVDDTNVRYIITGPSKRFIAGGRTIFTENLTRAPGKRQTPLDFGIITPALLQGYIAAKFVRTDRATGEQVFDLSYQPNFDDTSRHRVWLDAEKKYVVKREWYNQEGQQIATFFYDAPKKENGVWVPTRLTVKNVENKLAGVTVYNDIKVNSGLSDSLFK